MNVYPIKIYSEEYENTIKICIDCIDKCNYTCYYCYNMFFNHKRSNVEIDFNKVLYFIQHIRNANPNKKITVVLIGGEPTLHSNFLSFVKALYELKNIEIISFTNFSNDIDFYSKTISDYEVKYLVTFHYLNTDRTEKFFNKLNELIVRKHKNGIKTLNVMLLPQHFNETIEVFDRLYEIFKSDVNCHLLDIQDNLGKNISTDKVYSAEQLKTYEDRCKKNIDAENIVEFNDGTIKIFTDSDITNDKKTFNFKLWQCDAGLNYMYIKYDGNIYPCGAIMNKSIGNIYDLTTLKLHKTICSSNICPCEFGLRKCRIFK